MPCSGGERAAGKPGQTRYLGSDRMPLSMFPSPLICHVEEKHDQRDDRFLESCIADGFILFIVIEDRRLMKTTVDTSRNQRTREMAKE